VSARVCVVCVEPTVRQTVGQNATEVRFRLSPSSLPVVRGVWLPSQEGVEREKTRWQLHGLALGMMEEHRAGSPIDQAHRSVRERTMLFCPFSVYFALGDSWCSGKGDRLGTR
jgi:hypothetical protein